MKFLDVLKRLDEVTFEFTSSDDEIINEATEEELYDAGYEFTGIYTRDKEVAKEKAANEMHKYKGAKVKIVTVKDSKLKRGSKGRGYSVFILKTQAHKDADMNEIKQRQISQLKAEEKSLMKELNKIRKQIAALEE